MNAELLATIPKIRGVIRKRPLSKKELKKNDKDVTEVRSDQNIVVKELRYFLDCPAQCHFKFPKDKIFYNKIKIES